MPLKVPSLTTLSMFTSTQLDDLTDACRGTIVFDDTKNQVLVWDSEAWSPLFNKDVSGDAKFALLDDSSNVPLYASGNIVMPSNKGEVLVGDGSGP